MCTDTSSPLRAGCCCESVSLSCSATDRQRTSFIIMLHRLLSVLCSLSEIQTLRWNVANRKSVWSYCPTFVVRCVLHWDSSVILASQQVSLKWPGLRGEAGCWDGLKHGCPYNRAWLWCRKQSRQGRLAWRRSGREEGRHAQWDQWDCSGQAQASQQLSIAHQEAVNTTACVNRYWLPDWECLQVEVFLFDGVPCVNSV